MRFVLVVVFDGAQVFRSIPACVDLIEGPYIETDDAVLMAFRPSQLQKKS